MDLFLHSTEIQTRWSSYENPSAAKGAAAQSNGGLKGAPSAPLRRGDSTVLLDVKGSGIVRRIWMTLSDRSPETLRGLRIEFFWDSAETPAVSVPVGDFFGMALGRQTAFQSDLFCSPEGRSFVSLVPMPFRTAARIILTNHTSKDLMAVFYDVNLTLEKMPNAALYFHAIHRREQPTKLGHDFTILPHVSGRGRYLGANFGIITDPSYGGHWWGEGEVKCYLDGDREHPTLCGTGVEDYVSSAYGQGAFSQRYHGSPIADPPNRQWAFYRYHILDPIFFQFECRVTLQQIGGAHKKAFDALLESGAKAIPISIGHELDIQLLMQGGSEEKLKAAPETAWINFQRQDDVCATAYFYLDRPENELPR